MRGERGGRTRHDGGIKFDLFETFRLRVFTKYMAAL